jgi:hypothetical protein
MPKEMGSLPMYLYYMWLGPRKASQWDPIGRRLTVRRSHRHETASARTTRLVSGPKNQLYHRAVRDTKDRNRALTE